MQHLKSDDWTKEETDHLLDLCKRFDLRFIIIHDRYDRETYKNRDVEDLKDRYYFITNTLKRVIFVLASTSYYFKTMPMIIINVFLD